MLGSRKDISQREMKGSIDKKINSSIIGLNTINKSFKTQNTFKGKIGVFEIKDNKIHHQLNFYEISDGKLKEIF